MIHKMEKWDVQVQSMQELVLQYAVEHHKGDRDLTHQLCILMFPIFEEFIQFRKTFLPENRNNKMILMATKSVS